jgi:pimeloyl-ACP methyl ester carboxylesterase
MATFVCVHGAFQGGWVFARLARELRALGHAVHAPTLSGCGHHAHYKDTRLGLPVFYQDLVTYLELEDITDAILVAHSYSGLVCLGAMPDLLPRLAGLVCIEAILPDPGQSFAQLGGEPFRAMLTARLLDGWLVEPWPAPLFGVAGSPEADWFMARVAPFPLAGFTDPIPALPLRLPEKRHYLRCTQNPNPMLAAMAQKAEGLGFSLHAIASGHCPQVTVPGELARLLSGLAEAMAAAA